MEHQEQQQGQQGQQQGQQGQRGRKHVVVVGGGIGGLVVAAKCAQEGQTVTLLEANAEVGGRCQSHLVDTPQGPFRFDTGPSLLLFPSTYEETFASLGTTLDAHVHIQRVEPAYRVWFEGQPGSVPHRASASAGQGGGYLDLLYDIPRMLAQLEGVEAGAGRSYLGWLAQARAALEVGTRNFINRDFNNLLDLLDLRRLLPLLTQVDVLELLGGHNSRLARRFKDPRLQALLSFQDLYVGLSPYTAPGVFSLLAATEVTDGVFYPVGGFQAIKDGLHDVAQGHGVAVRTGARVERITTEACGGGAGQRATGVVLEGGEHIKADAVVSNRDVPLTYELLDSKPYASQQQAKLSSLEYSASVIAYYFCLDKELPGLQQHNIFVSGQFRRSWERATGAASLLPRPNFYVHCPSRTDASAAPPGCDSLMVLLPVGNMQEVARAAGPGGSVPDAYAGLVEAGLQAICRTFRDEGVCGNLMEHVLHKSVIDPVEWKRRYGIQHGAVFGLSHSLPQLALLRPGARDDQVKGLYRVGASARPGNGVPLCMISGDLTARRVLQDVQSGAI